ncbi:MAG TPA: dipeptidase, partial [Acidobacteriaceae bacterium]|nr:dipeptidase [Acidobacteriaceae bacterium]
MSDSNSFNLHASALVIDTHADTPQRFADESWDFTGPLGRGMLNLETARQGNLAAEFFAIWPEPTIWRGRFAHRTLTLIDSVHQQVRRHPDQLALCTSPAEILAAREAGKFAMLMGIEGGHAIENSLALLRTYYTLGVRYMTLTWANSNEWADSSSDLDDTTVPHHNGLTDFGREVVAEMNRLGMMVDVSHASDKTLADVLAVTRAPVLASHSCARALTPAPRNLTDDQLRAIAANGGAIMVNFYSAFIDDNYRQAHNAQKPERSIAHAALEEEYAARNTPIPYHAANAIDTKYAARIPRPPVDSLIAHFEHIIRVAGIDHVGIGSDFDGISSLP